jgi:hypothetical protein
MKRREFLLAVLATSLPAVHLAHAADETVTVYKSPS